MDAVNGTGMFILRLLGYGTQENLSTKLLFFFFLDERLKFPTRNCIGIAIVCMKKGLFFFLFNKSKRVVLGYVISSE